MGSGGANLLAELLRLLLDLLCKLLIILIVVLLAVPWLQGPRPHALSHGVLLSEIEAERLSPQACVSGSWMLYLLRLHKCRGRRHEQGGGASTDQHRGGRLEIGETNKWAEVATGGGGVATDHPSQGHLSCPLAVTIKGGNGQGKGGQQ